MRSFLVLLVIVTAGHVVGVSVSPHLAPPAFIELPLGSSAPTGWLLKQLQIQRDGLTGYLALFWDQAVTNQDGIANSMWIGGPAGKGGLHEETTYWLNGAVPLAYLLRAAEGERIGTAPDQYGVPPMPQDLLGQVHTYLDYILAHQEASGWMGPDDISNGNNYWCRYNLLHALHYYAEGEPSRWENITTAMLRLQLEMYKRMQGPTKLFQWAQYRYQDLILAIQWLLDHAPQGHEADLLAFVNLTHSQGFDWEDWFGKPWGHDKAPNMNVHGVNNAQALKSAAVLWRSDPQQAYIDSSRQRMQRLDKELGIPTGLFIADELYEAENPSRHPSRGTETCTVVEAMFSYNTMFSVHGVVEYADRAEEIAFNGGLLWAHQYLQAVNQINAEVCDPHVWKHDAPSAMLYGLNGGCCTANFNQGWPKFATHVFYGSADGGAAIGLLVPSRATLPEEYPFEDIVTVLISAVESFVLQMRVPAWPNNATFTVNGGEERPTISIPPGDTTVVMDIRPEIYLKKWDNGSVSIHRGALLFSIPVGEMINITRHYAYDSNDYVVKGTTPWRYALVYDDSRPAKEQLTYHRTGFVPGSIPFDVREQPPCHLTGMVRRVRTWEEDMSAPTWPPVSPACGTSGHCDDPIAMTFLPHGATDLRMGEIPLA